MFMLSMSWYIWHAFCFHLWFVKHLRIAILPKGVIGLLSHIINKLFTSWNFVSKFNRAQLPRSFVNHIPSILNLVGFHSNFRCVMYLMLLLVFDPNHTTIVFSVLIFNPDLFAKSSRTLIVSSNVLLFPFWNNSVSSANWYFMFGLTDNNPFNISVFFNHNC